ncbi:MAG: hypothetical protein A3F41_02880 [Coxiella sp. RIFCSPHIGHO2_12_FULL_44_14]|nr:MAG: hypothetical protein A3F41_02880 [Coxiella sp. RIFCSPHIGHO2_12_FULL_44_14]
MAVFAKIVGDFDAAGRGMSREGDGKSVKGRSPFPNHGIGTRKTFANYLEFAYLSPARVFHGVFLFVPNEF